MKKVGTILLTIYVTLVTVGCAVFGYLYFSSISGKSSSALTRAEALVLVNEVYKERGLGSSKAASALSLDYEDYSQNEFSQDVSYLFYMHDASIILAKSLLESDVEENVWYQSTEQGFHGFLRFYIDGQSVLVENTDSLDNQLPENQDKYEHNTALYVTKESETAWSSAFVFQTLTTVGPSGTGCTIAYTHFKSENNNIYECAHDQFTSTRKSSITENVTNLDEILNVNTYKCNLKTHKVLDRLAAKESLLTEDEKLTIVNDLIDTAQQIFKIRVLADFGDYSTDLPEDIFDAVQEYVSGQM